MRIGIWCDYGFTLGPSEGIGVFVDNLARGLVKADATCRVLLKAHQGQTRILDSTVAGGLGRIEVTSGPYMSRGRRRILRNCKKVRRALNRPDASRPIAHRVDTWAQKLIDYYTAPITGGLQEMVRQCDVWLLPYVGLDQDIEGPTVVAIHDLVTYHFPEMMAPCKLDALKRLVERISNRSTLAVCMSNFICQHDLLDTLHLPPSRVRVLKSAVPDDLGQSVDQSEPGGLNDQALSDQAWSVLPFARGTPYLFYPAAFRTYKNHRYLVEALHLFRQENRQAMKVVFTGIHRCPKPIEQLVGELGLQDQVVVLKKVSREVLQQLYANAFATVVPSLYEQGSFPLMEALRCGCPVASADIPSLREQFAGMGDSMFYFDPHQPAQLLPILKEIQHNRQQIIARQAAGFASMRQTTWADAAEGWLQVFREAIALNSSIEQARYETKAA